MVYVPAEAGVSVGSGTTTVGVTVGSADVVSGGTAVAGGAWALGRFTPRPQQAQPPAQLAYLS